MKTNYKRIFRGYSPNEVYGKNSKINLKFKEEFNK